MSTNTATTNYSSLARCLNSNIPLKLDKTIYINRKTQVIPAIRADLEDTSPKQLLFHQDSSKYTHMMQKKDPWFNNNQIQHMQLERSQIRSCFVDFLALSLQVSSAR
ncbi:hypothetical protein ACOSP7_013693 [Xanthoceras sorbifolium]